MEQPDLLRRIIQVLEEMEIPYVVVGSIASGAYGEPRMTQDIDVVVDIHPDQVARFCAAFPPEEFYVSPQAALRAVRTRGQFNVIHPTSGNKIDLIVLKKEPWNLEQMSRRRREKLLPGCEGYVASPADVIISKMAYYREGGSEKHLRDITGILKVSGEEVDRAYVAQWSRALGLTEIWQAILRRLGEGQR